MKTDCNVTDLLVKCDFHSLFSSRSMPYFVVLFWLLRPLLYLLEDVNISSWTEARQTWSSAENCNKTSNIAVTKISALAKLLRVRLSGFIGSCFKCV